MLGGPALLNGVFELPTHFKNFSNNHTYAKYRKPLKPGQKQLDTFTPNYEADHSKILLDLVNGLHAESKMCYEHKHYWMRELFDRNTRANNRKK